MKNFVRRIRNIGNSGSTLIAVLVVTTILSLFLITLQPIMLNYAQRSIDERDLKQAEFSARSANDAIVKEIVAGNATLIAGINNISSNGSSLVLDNFTFSSSQMGSVEGKIQRISAEEFSVVTRAIVNGEQRTIGRSLTKSSVNTGILALSSFYFYNANFSNRRGFNVTGNIPVVVENSFDINGGDIDVGGNLILLASNTSLTRVRNDNGRVNIQGNLYTGTGNFRIQNRSEITIKDKTYKSANSEITSSVNNNDDKYCEYIFNTNILTNLHNQIPSWVNFPGTTYVSGNLNGGTGYIMSGTRTLNLANLLNADVTPENPAYIILPNSARLTLSAILPGDALRNPKVVFILQGNAQLTLRHDSSAVVYGSNSTVLNINRPGGGVSDFYGQIRVGSIVSNSNNQINLHYRSISSGSGSGTVEWTPGLYKKATY